MIILRSITIILVVLRLLVPLFSKRNIRIVHIRAKGDTASLRNFKKLGKYQLGPQGSHKYKKDDY